MVQSHAMEQRVGGFDPEEYHRGMRLREQLALLPRLTPEQVTSALRVLGRREEQFLDYVRTSPDEAREELARDKVALARRKGSEPSRPNQVADKIVHGIYYPMHTVTMEVYRDPKIPKGVFISWYDYASGIIDVTSDILEAEQEMEGVTDKHAVETVTRMEEENRSLPLDASTRLYLFQMNKAKRNARLLMEDPTGNKLIETSVGEIRQDAAREARERTFHRLHNYQEPQMVLAGADFARRAYQALYPLTR
jgi:hypothetical protein